MQREFEIYSRPSAPSVAVKRGFSWPGFFLVWIWAFSRGLPLHGTLLLAATLAIGALKAFLFTSNPIVGVLLGLILCLFVGIRGNSWRSEKLERDGYGFVGLVQARSAAAAVARVALGQAPASARSKRSSFFRLPAGLQSIAAMIGLTWKAAFRFKLFLVVAVLLLGCVVALPLLIKDDGTARGFTQILLTYTLSVITGLLGLSTLWLACGTLARDIEDCQIQMVVTKPISRWQIWLGKWLGILSLNATLLAVAGGSVYVLMQWRSTRLSPEQQTVLRKEVFIARGSIKEQSFEADIDKMTRELLDKRRQEAPVGPVDLTEVERQIRERVKASYQVVASGSYRPWVINLGLARHQLRGQPLQLRVKFNAANRSPLGTFNARWTVGVPQKTQFWQSEVMRLAPDTFHEFEIPPDHFDDQGNLTIVFYNINNGALLFPLEDGMEVLYREGGFGLNYIRGLGIIFCWMALLAALGLASATFLSFPVAAFSSMSVLCFMLSTGTLETYVSDAYARSLQPASRLMHTIDSIGVALSSAALWVINLARNFSPIEALSTGRSVSWLQLGHAVLQILLLSAFIGSIGILIFNRRELATAQQ